MKATEDLLFTMLTYCESRLTVLYKFSYLLA